MSNKGQEEQFHVVVKDPNKKLKSRQTGKEIPCLVVGVLDEEEWGKVNLVAINKDPDFKCRKGDELLLTVERQNQKNDTDGSHPSHWLWLYQAAEQWDQEEEAKPEKKRRMRPAPKPRRATGKERKSGQRSSRSGSTRSRPKSEPKPKKKGDNPPPNLGQDIENVLIRKEEDVLNLLNRPLDLNLVSEKTYGNFHAYFIAGNDIIDQANRIFGYAGWSYEVLDAEMKPVPTGNKGEAEAVYLAKIRVKALGVERTDVGFCDLAGGKSGPKTNHHMMAWKGAVTDGLKRAMRGFGNQFGNSLYGDED